MKALEGVIVADFGQYLAGPFGPMLLGDLGATVIKVEPIRGDGMRMMGQPFFGCSRGKQDLAVDVKTEEGLEIAHRLVARADVVHHNMTLGVAERLKLDYETVKRINEQVIYCHTWAYGPHGALARFGGLDPIYQAACGLEYALGAVHDGNPPLYSRFGVADYANGLSSALGVVMALLHRRRTGEGQSLWTSIHLATALFSSDAFLREDGTSIDVGRVDKAQTGPGPLYRLYECQDGQWLQIAVLTEAHWGSLSGVAGDLLPADDARFATADARRANASDLADRLEELFRRRTAREWHAMLDQAGVPNEISVDTLNGETVLFDDENVRLGLVAEYEHPTVGRMRQFGHLINFSDTPGHIAGPPPLLGQHTRPVMQWLGYDDSVIDDYRERGIVYLPGDDYTASWPW